VDIPELIVSSNHSNKVWATYLKQIHSLWDTVEIPQLYDVIAMAYDIRHPKIVQHVGIYIGNGKILHTLEKVGSHIVDLKDINIFIRGYHRWRS